ncbi:hypothetical protein [Mesobacillus sp. S13]|uniref:hypothetical protein n=1 Tax=Mesobacillus sp. S13 TaxID=2880221 RepID=UPI001CF1D438|nr:hypothetical protein [Mesobacillus sp. S13]
MNDLSDLDRLFDENETLRWELFHAKKRINSLEKRAKNYAYTIRKLNDRLRKLDPKDRYYNSNGKRKAGKR